MRRRLQNLITRWVKAHLSSLFESLLSPHSITLLTTEVNEK